LTGSFAVMNAEGITKQYATVIANAGVSLDLKAGEIHAVLGENGAGKSTLMKIIYGMEAADRGHVAIDGKTLDLRSPRDAIDAGIGMVHQHFMLVDNLTVFENLIIGTSIGGRVLLARKSGRAHITKLARRYGIEVNLNTRISHLSVGEQQRVEILKALVRGAQILILDEPTAVLTPQEVSALAVTLRKLASEGHGILIVTHKLSEVMAMSNRVTVMRRGKVVGTWCIEDISERDLIEHMVGRSVEHAVAREGKSLGRPMLSIKGVRAPGDGGRIGLDGVDLEVAAGEILGIAGVDGNGQRELAEVIAGLRRVQIGEIRLDGAAIANHTTEEILYAGVAHIPEDRNREGLVPDFSVAENAILVNHDRPPIQRGGFLNAREVGKFVDSLIRDFVIRCSNNQALTRGLSGGNQQKLVLGRELSRNPKLLIAMQPTRGLDVGAIEYVRRRLLDQASLGTAILLISSELDEILALSDRVAVLRDGKIAGMLPRYQASAEKIGPLMLAKSSEGSRIA
jgi:general nucleoside transport system ATP-binding protein